MADPFPPRSAEHYRHMAEQMREAAATEPEGSELRQKLLELATQYDLLAERART